MRQMMSRLYNSPVNAQDTVTRVMCLGDSMIYGYGVGLYDSLPAQLEYFLNKALLSQEIEVVNHAIPGDSLYDQWLQFKIHGKKYNPDLLVIFLCENDAELPCAVDNYLERVEYSWDPHQPIYKYFTSLFSDMKSYSEEKKLPVVIGFYYTFDNQYRQLCSTQLKQICQSNKLYFIDISEEFMGQLSGDINKNIVVSNADPHPSAYGHKIAAMCVARNLIKDNFLVINNENALSHKSIHDQMITNCIDKIQCGHSPVISIYQLQRLIAAKNQSKALAKIPDSERLPNSVIQKMNKDLNNLLEYTVFGLLVEGYHAMLKSKIDIVYQAQFAFETAVLDIAKCSYLLEYNIQNNIWDYQPYEQVEKLYTELDIIKLKNDIEQWLSVFSKAEKVLTFLPSISTELNLLHELLVSRFTPAVYKIRELWNAFEATAHELLKNVNAFYSIISQHDVYCEAFLQAHASNLYNAYKKFDTTCILAQIKKIASFNTFEVERPETTISVKLKNESKEFNNCFLLVESTVPSQNIIRDSHHLHNDGKEHTYYFNIPLVVFFNFRLKFHKPECIDFKECKIYINENRQITVKKEHMTEYTPGNYYSDNIFLTVP